MANQNTIEDKNGDVHVIEDDYLAKAGFTRDEEERDAHQSVADASGMDDGGPYFVRGKYKKGDVTITFEVNVSTLEQGGMKSQITHPQVCVIESPKGRVACSAQDTALQLQLAEELA